MTAKGRFLTTVAMRQQVMPIISAHQNYHQKSFLLTKWRRSFHRDKSSMPLKKGMLLEAEWIYPSSSTSSSSDSDVANRTTNKDNDNNNNNNNSFAVILHGLMGNTRNVKGLAKSVCDSLQIPSLLMDLRGHGKTFLLSSNSSSQLESSSSSSSSNSTTKRTTLQDCVWDVHRTLSHHVPELSLISSYDNNNNNNNNAKKPSMPSWTLMGHSLGGRIAMLYSITPEIMSLQQRPSNLWLLDTVPGGIHPSVERVIQVALQLNGSGSSETRRIIWKSRKELTDYLVNQGTIEIATAQWLASSYDLAKGSFQFDLNIAQDLIQDFANVDFMSWMEEGIFQRGSGGGGDMMRIDLVRGGANLAWQQQQHNASNSSTSSMSPLERIASWQKQHHQVFGFHTLPNAGHWVHIDDRKGLLAAIESVHLNNKP